MNPEATKDRAIGALLGLAVGDAVGTTLEFTGRDTYRPLTDMVGGGPFGLSPGQWTDDTSMALCLADSLLACGTIDQKDLMNRFVRWLREGENSCTGRCFDIGNTVGSALAQFERDGNPVAGSTDPHSAGNGSLMRLAPVSIFWSNDRVAAAEAARAQSKTTHGAEAAIDACAYFSGILVDAIQGMPKEDLLRPRKIEGADEVVHVASGSWKGRSRKDIQSPGYVIHTLEAALWVVDNASDFKEAILLAANLGSDADTVAAVTGQLAGSIWGADEIPQSWKMRLAWRKHIENLGEQLFDRHPHTSQAKDMT